ncbi:MAG: nuclear transport factor 2 family protein [Gaiellales bacterium]
MGRAPARRGPRPDAARRARVPDTTAARTIEAALNAWNAHDPQAYEALLDDDYFGETHGAPAPLRGRSGALWAMQMKLRLFPDLQFKIQDTMTSGNDVIVSWVATATRGNERVRVPGCTVGALRRGRVTHTWCYWDTDDMLAPLRVISGRPSDGPPTVHRLPTTP